MLFPSHSPDLEMGTRKMDLSRGAEVMAASETTYWAPLCLADSRRFPTSTTRSTRAVLRTYTAWLLLTGDVPTLLCSSRNSVCWSEPLDRLEGALITSMGGVHAWKFGFRLLQCSGPSVREESISGRFGSSVLNMCVVPTTEQ